MAIDQKALETKIMWQHTVLETVKWEIGILMNQQEKLKSCGGSLSYSDEGRLKELREKLDRILTDGVIITAMEPKPKVGVEYEDLKPGGSAEST